MVRFSCFNAHIGLQKSKKTVQPSVEEMHKTLEDFSQVQASKGLIKATEMNSAEAIVEIQDSVKPFTDSSTVCHRWKSVEIKQKIDLDADTSVHQKQHYLKKSLSVGSKLCLEERVPGKFDMDDVTDQRFSSNSHDHGLVGEDGSQEPVVSQKAAGSESVQVSFNHDNLEQLFSMVELTDSEKDGLNLHLSSESADGSGDRTPNNAPLIVKSCSMPNIVASEISSGEHSPFNNLTTHPTEDVHDSEIRREDISVYVGASVSGDRTPNNAPLIVKSYSMPNIVASELISGEHSPSNKLTTRPRSSEDVHVFDIRQEDISIHEYDIGVVAEQERDDSAPKNQNNNFENTYYDGYDSHSYSASAKDCLEPGLDEVNSGKLVQEELTGKDFKIKLIENWVNDLQYCSPLEETFELSDPIDHLKSEPAVPNVLTAAKADVKVPPGMDAAKGYLSSLGASATTAQLANHGLVGIPFLSAFVSLKVLNLSGNAIAKISAGTLPRGLHMLNLSKNNISTIEGLRELTRLRVLDLSYNRIFRIGHGLASCSSLKELYLAGNKISEVDGLHRLLKLTVLDLRFNKISTTKSLGLLAANYNSLQAISLEGNPAQKNVGDEHLKKHLQGLLPHLVYFNRQAIKVSTLRDAAERSVRLGVSAHQFDRGLRSERKATRKTNHSNATNRPSSSTHSPKRQAIVSSRHSKSSHRRLPAATATKPAISVGSKTLNIEAELPMRRTQSVGTLGPM